MRGNPEPVETAGFNWLGRIAHQVVLMKNIAYAALLVLALLAAGCCGASGAAAEGAGEEESSVAGTETESGWVVIESKCLFTGNWDSNWGDMVFTQDGDTVTATYTHDEGRITGTMTGNVLVGKWSESPTYSEPNDGGDVELQLSEDCDSFEGHWRYGSSGDWSGGWTGTRK